MSAAARVHRAKGFEGAPIVLMNRVYDGAGAVIVQGAITSIAYRVWEYASEDEADRDENGEQVGAEASLTVASVVYNTLQTASPWDSTRDSTGYNFRFTLPSACRPTGGTWHRVEVVFNPSAAGEEDFPIVWIIETLPRAGS
jgi:hypothetical protein